MHVHATNMAPLQLCCCTTDIYAEREARQGPQLHVRKDGQRQLPCTVPGSAISSLFTHVGRIANQASCHASHSMDICTWPLELILGLYR